MSETRNLSLTETERRMLLEALAVSLKAAPLEQTISIVKAYSPLIAKLELLSLQKQANPENDA